MRNQANQVINQSKSFRKGDPMVKGLKFMTSFKYRTNTKLWTL